MHLYDKKNHSGSCKSPQHVKVLQTVDLREELFQLLLHSDHTVA